MSDTTIFKLKTNNLVRALATMMSILTALIMFACNGSDPNDGETVDRAPTPLPIPIPSNFPEPIYNLQNNPVTEEGFELGKKLFYDVRLSRNNTISCGFCHMQPTAFTHHGHDVSHGVDDKLGRRNSLPVQNLIFYKTFFWDGGVPNLDLVPLNAIANEVEMDEEVDNIITKLQGDAEYRRMFKAAFNSEEITSTAFLQALSQFMATMVSANSRYDLYVRKEENSFLTAEEIEGMILFKQKCATCHATDLFTDQSYHNNGFSSVQALERDSGREEITLNPDDRGKFKVPSLRNVAYTSPYMHNGKLNTLEDVLEFYSSGVHDTPTLDPLLRTGEKPGLDLTSDEKNRIIAFLNTLSDPGYITNKRFSEF